MRAVCTCNYQFTHVEEGRVYTKYMLTLAHVPEYTLYVFRVLQSMDTGSSSTGLSETTTRQWSGPVGRCGSNLTMIIVLNDRYCCVILTDGQYTC